MQRDLSKGEKMNIDWRPPTLETSRLILRALTEADAEGVFAYAGNPNVTVYTLFETHRNLGDSLAFIRDMAMEQYAQQLPGPFAICLKENPNRTIGTVGCRWATQANKTLELGYAIAEDYWGRGLVAEASRRVIQFAFDHYDVIRLQAHCMAGNDASLRVMEKLGMKFEGCVRSAIFRRGRMWDMLLYSILRNEWFAKSESEFSD